MIEVTDDSTRVLVFTPTANDGPIAAQVLNASGVLASPCDNVQVLCEKIVAGCGAVILSEEALVPEVIESIHQALDKQEPWSDLPILLLTNADVVRVTELFSKSGNISLLERPFSRLTFVRSAEVALRARKKQYEVRDLVRELVRSKEEADRANVTKSQFLANMSHEIRTPIGAIMGFIDLIKNSASSPEEVAEFLEITDRNSQQLLRLVDDILDLSKVEAGKMAIEQIGFKLNEFLTDFMYNMSLKASEKGIVFQTQLETHLPDKIISDPFRLKQVLSNVVGNAIKFTSSGHVRMSVAYQDPCLRFTVLDTGIGLSSEQAAKLFQPFSQADSSTTRKFGGTGLGLILSRRLAEAMGGNLKLKESTPGAGSTFVIHIKPTVAPDAALVEMDGFTIPVEKSTAPESRTALDGLKVLLVEDSADNQVLIATYLRKTGARIEIRSDGAQGVQAATENDFDVVLMDIQMPRMDGHEATRKLRHRKYTKPIIALTAHAMEEERKRCFESGFTDYLTKPIQHRRLVDVLSRYMPH